MAANNKSIANIIGTGKNEGHVFFPIPDTNLYAEVVVQSNGEYVASGKQYKLDEIMKNQAVQVTKPVEKTAVDAAKKMSDLITGFTQSLATLPDKTQLARMAESAKNQLVIGDIVIPAVMTSLESISRSIDLSRLEQFQKTFGIPTATKEEIERWNTANAIKQNQISQLDIRLKGLNPQSPDYTKQVNAIELEKARIEEEFLKSNPVPKDPIAETKSIVSERIGTLMDAVSSMVSSINKVSNIDLDKIPGPMKLQRNMRRLAGSMSNLVNVTIKEFSKIDLTGSEEALALLIGDSGTEKTLETIKSLETGGNSKGVTTSTEKVISGKKASILDIMTAFLDACTKVTSFEFKPFLNKSTRFRAMAPVMAMQMRGIVTDIIGMYPSNIDYQNDQKKIEDFNKFLEFFNEHGLEYVANLKINVKKIKTVKDSVRAARRAIVGKKSNKKENSGIISDIHEMLVSMSSECTVDPGKAVDNFEELASAIIDGLDTLSKMKTASKSIRGVVPSLILSRAAFSQVNVFAQELANSYDKETTTQQYLAITESTNLMQAILPGFAAFGDMARRSRGIKEKDLVNIEISLDTYTDVLAKIANNLSRKSGQMQKLETLDLAGVSEKLLEMVSQLSDVRRLANRLGKNSDWMDPLFGEDGVIIRYTLALVNLTKIINKKGVSTEQISIAANSAEELAGMTTQIAAILSSARLIAVIAKRTEVDDSTIDKTEKLVKLLLKPIEVLGTEETTEKIKNSKKNIKDLALCVLILTGTALLVGILVFNHAAQIAVGLAVLTLMVLGSIKILERLSRSTDDIRAGGHAMLMIAGAFLMFSLSILLLGLSNGFALKSLLGFAAIVTMSLLVLWAVQKITQGGIDKGTGLPMVCKPLLAIAGSFIMFSLSLLLLGLVQDLTLKSLLGFAVVVGLSVGVLFLLSKFKSDVIKGSLAMLIMGAAFIVFAGVMAILARIAESMDFLNMLGLVGLIGALIGIGMLAGVGIIPLALGAAGIILLSVGLLTMAIAIAALTAVSKSLGDPQETLQPMMDTIGFMVRALAALSVGTIAIAMVNSVMLAALMVSMTVVCLAMNAIQAMAPSNEDIPRLGDAMSGIVDAISVVTSKLAEISLIDVGKALIVSALALGMLVPLSLITLILLGLSRLRIATKFDDQNKPVEWESLNGSSFDRISETMSGVTGALQTVTKELSDISLISITKALVVSVEALAMMASLTGVMALLMRIGTRRIPVAWDKDNNPTAWETLGDNDIQKAGATTGTLLDTISGIADQIGNYSMMGLTKAAANARKMKSITNSVGSILDLVVKLSSGPISYGEVDADGNLVPGTTGKIQGSLGDYIRSHSSQISKNIDSLIGVFNDIANQVAGEGGIGTIDKSTLKRSKKNIKIVSDIVGSLDPAIALIKSLSSGEYTIIGDDGKEEKVNLGTYLNKNTDVVRRNIAAVISMVQGIATDVTKAFDSEDSVSRRSLKRSNRKIGKVGQILNTLNPAMDLIVRLSEGEFAIEGENGEETKKVNLGDYLAKQSSVVEGNITTLINFVQHIATRAAELGEDESSSRRSMRRGEKKAGLVGSVLETLMTTMDLINQLALGQIQVGVNEDGSPIMDNMTEFLNKNSAQIHKNIDTLLNFITGAGGIQEHLDQLSGEKESATEKKQNSIGLVQSMTDTISSILDMTVKLGEKVNDPATAELFGTDTSTNLRGRLGRLLEGYAVPLEDSAIFAKQSDFQKRFVNLTNYDKLMKSIMDVKNVSNYEKSVDATEKMVTSINSINDTKIDKLNQLMVNMVKFGETMDDALKNVLDQVVELAEELHYIIEANEQKNNPNGQQNQQNRNQGGSQASGQNAQNQGSQTVINQTTQVDVSTIEDRLQELTNYVRQIQQGLR